MSLPLNPYIAGAPLRGEKGFFGRQDIMEWVERELRNSQTNALVLFGQRRIGKTTLLLQLARNLSQDEFLPIYFDLQDQATRPLGKTLTDIADTLCEKANLDLGQLGPFDDEGRYFQREFLPNFYVALGEKRRPVFLLDEFDVLDQTAEAELVETATAKALFPLLRRLMTTDARSAFVFVVGRRAEDLSIDFNATFKASLVREIWVIDDKSAEAIVRQAQTNGTLKFTDDAIQRVLSLTNRHPYLTQLLCQRVWELAYASGISSPAEIDSTQVETALESSLEAGNQALDWLWSGLNPAEKIYASALAEIAGENETIPEERIIEVLATHAARLRTREIELAPRDLVKRHVLDVNGERSYRFAVELFRRWVHKNKALMVVKDEVDRIDPMADRFFVFGDGFYDARQWEKAAFYFREALNVNPRHFRARLYLGETLLEQGKVDEAIAELDQALILDREEARLPLARAWLAKAEMLKPEGDSNVLLQAYEKALELSPRESQAIEGRASIWIQRAKQAEERGDLSVALDAYRQANDQANIDRLTTIEHERLLGQLQNQAQEHVKADRWELATLAYAQMVELASEDASRLIWQAELEKAQSKASEQQAKEKAKIIEKMKIQAQTHEQRGEWENAIQAYENLLQMNGEDVWKTSLEKARNEQEMLVIFGQGRKALLKEDWKEALRLFAQLIQSRPDYSHDGLFAVDLLQDSIKRRKGRSYKAIQAVRRNRVTLTRILMGLVGIVVLCVFGIGIFSLYTHYQKPFSVGDTVEIYDLPNSEETITLTNASRLEEISNWYINDSVFAIAISPDSTLMAVSFYSYGKYYDNYIAIFQIESGTSQQVFYGHSDAVTSLDFSPDGTLLAAGTNGYTAKIWNIQTGKLVRTLEGHTSYVTSVAFSPNGNLLASASSDGTVRLWQVSDGSLVQTLQGRTDDVYVDVAFSPDGTLLATGSNDYTAKIWNIQTGELVRTLEGHTAAVYSVAFSPNGNLLASASSDGTVRLWQVSDGSLVQTLQGHIDSVDDIAFSPDGTLLATTSSDSTMRLWQVSDGTLITTVGSYSSNLVFSPNGKWLVAGSFSISFWGIAPPDFAPTPVP